MYMLKKIYKKYIKNKKNIKKKIILPNFVNIKKFAKLIKIKEELIIKSMKLLNFKIKNIVNNDILLLILDYINIIAFKKIKFSKLINFTNTNIKCKKNFIKRNLIVTFTGHVDSGKTSIIKKLTNKNIKEDSGITQNISFYNFKYKKNIILIDTPGHEDFNNFRKNSIKITDLIILLISAKDNLVENFKNIIKYIKNFKIPIIILLNKTDIINFKFNYIINKLLNKGIIRKIDIKKLYFFKFNINNNKKIFLLINILKNFYYIINPKINVKNFFRGIVIENKNFKKFGLLTTIFIKSGKLKIKDIILFKENFYKIKYILNKNNKSIKSSKNNIIIKLSGLSKIINTGDLVNKINNIKLIKNIIINKKKKKIILKNLINLKLIDDLKLEQQNNSINKLNIILILNDKDTLLSIKKNLYKLSDKYIKINIIDYSIAGLNNNLIKKAKFLNSYLINFKNIIKKKFLKIMENYKVKFKTFENIYNLNNYIKLIKKKIIFKKKLIGKAIINKIFKIKENNVAGCKILNGIIKINSKIKLFREGNFIYEGKLESLNYLKTQVSLLKKGYECGIIIKNFNNFIEKDIIYIYNV